MPSVLSLVISFGMKGRIEPVMAVCLFLVAIFMQSSVNTLNDYADFKKGTDTLDNSPDATDAVIVYGLNPDTARNIGIIFLVLAFIPGLYACYVCGYVPLVIGIIGALVIVGYSSGKLPISYLPIGEAVSGFVMGGLIPLAGVYMQTLCLDFKVLLMALPVILGIAMIMFSNNGCDIERDVCAGRHTMPVLLGRKRTDKLYRIMLIVWILCPIVISLFSGRYMAVLVYVLELPVVLFGLMRQFAMQLGEQQRGMIMGGISNLNIAISFAYMVAILLA
jgi:1,4-dihydroxy-2-naphthoate octaprenyltransferase